MKIPRKQYQQRGKVSFSTILLVILSIVVGGLYFELYKADKTPAVDSKAENTTNEETVVIDPDTEREKLEKAIEKPLEKELIKVVSQKTLTKRESYRASLAASPPLDLDLKKTRLKTSIESSEDKVNAHPLSKIIDGDATTYYWTGSKLEKGDTIEVTFAAPLPVGKRLKVVSGLGVKNREDADHIEHGVLEASRNKGRTWSQIAKFHAGKAEAKVEFLTSHYRIRITKPISHWVAIRHIDVSNAALTQKTIAGTAMLDGKEIPLTITIDFEGFNNLKPRFKEMAKLYFEVWPKLVTWLGVPEEQIPRDIDIFLVKTLPHPAHAIGHTITIDSRHLLNHPADTAGVFVHELSHLVQHYGSYQPTWFVEGSADYVRYRQFPNGKWANDRRKTMNNKRPYGHYWDSACFLLWMEDSFNKSIVSPVSRAIHDGEYTDDLFMQLTGKSLERLADSYKTSGYRPDRTSPKF